MEDTKPAQPKLRSLDGFTPGATRQMSSPAPSPAPAPAAAPASSPAPNVVPVAVASAPSEDRKDELIPGLNTKPSETSFDAPTLSPQTNSSPIDDNDKDAPNLVSPPSKPTKKGKGPAVFIAIIVALALIVGAGYGYWQHQHPAKPTATPTTTQTPAASASPSAKVEGASTKIDNAIKNDETKDFQETDLSDTTLGL